ncbi:hypothetical protein [Arthrobacter tecti]
MRTVGSAFFVLFTVVFGVLALPSAWIATHVVSEEGFVQLASELSEDPEFTQALADALSVEATAGVDLPSGIAETVQPIVAGIAERITELPGFEQAWDETLTRSHLLTFADPRELPPEADASSSFTLDVAPLVALVTTEIGNQFGVDVPAPEQTLVNIGQANHRALLERVETAASLWPALTAAAAIGAVLSLLIARRRSTTLAVLGLGAVLGGALLWFAAGFAPQIVDQTADANAVADVFKDALTVRAADSFQAWCLAAIAVGLLVSVAGLAARLLSGSQRGRVPSDRVAARR